MEFTPGVYALIACGSFGLFFAGSVFHGEMLRRYGKKVAACSEEVRKLWEAIAADTNQKRDAMLAAVAGGSDIGGLIKLHADGRVETEMTGLEDMSPELRAAFRQALTQTLEQLKKSDN